MSRDIRVIYNVENLYQTNYGSGINTCCCGPDSLLFDIGPPFFLPGLSKSPKLQGVQVLYKLRDDMGFSLKLQGKSRRGNPVDFTTDTIEATSSDETILTVTVEEGSIVVKPVGPLGTAQVQVTLPDIDTDTEGDQPLSGIFDVEVVSGVAASIVFTPGTSFPLDLPEDV